MTALLQTPITVIGAGSWGTALALVLAQNNQTVRLWGHSPKHIQAMQNTRCNENYLPDIPFPNNLQLYDDLATALADVNDILIAVPSHAFRNILEIIIGLALPQLPQMRILWATKGLDPHTSKLLSDVVVEIIGTKNPLAVLSGPSFAKEVAKGLPTAVTIATHDQQFGQDLTTRLHTQVFRVYTNTDLIGVQLGGAMKNILAIAAGIGDGLGMGSNARAALLTRGLSEMMRLGLAMGGRQETLIGLSGLGDLILTCTDNQSRNRRFGLAIANGKSTQQAIQEIGQIVEGIPTTAEIHQLAQRLSIEMPITNQVFQLLYQGLSPKEAAYQLLAREPRAEH